MKLTPYLIGGEGDLVSGEVEQALRDWRDQSGSSWIDIEAYQPEELQAWLEQLDLSPFAKRRLVNQGAFAQVVPASDAVLVELRIVPADGSDEIRQVTALCLKHLLITFDRKAQKGVGVFNHAAGEMELMDPSWSGILCSLLLFFANQTARDLREIRSRIFEFDELMDRDPAAVGLEEILAQKDKLLKLLAVAEEQLECFESLAKSSSEALDFSNLRGAMGLLLATAGSTERMAGRLEKRVADLRQRHEAHQRDKMDHRLAVLTILSAVFLPLTFFAGIWGMNFEAMPELGHPYAYFFALGLMACAGGGMLWFFYRRGWFQ